MTQAELNDPTQDLNLSKESAQLLGSPLREKHLLAPGATFYWYREHEREFRYLFTFDKASSLVYCNNIADLIEFPGLKYDAMEWSFSLTHLTEVSRLFFWIKDISSHRSLLGTQLKWKNPTKARTFCCLL